MQKSTQHISNGRPVLRKGENWTDMSWRRGENQQPTCAGHHENRTWATLLGGERSHHYPVNPAPIEQTHTMTFTAKIIFSSASTPLQT